MVKKQVQFRRSFKQMRTDQERWRGGTVVLIRLHSLLKSNTAYSRR